MAILDRSRAAFRTGLGKPQYADEICDIIDAGTGTIGAAALRGLQVAMGKVAGLDLFTIVNADDGAISDETLRRLKLCCADEVAANDINAGIIANVDE